MKKFTIPITFHKIVNIITKINKLKPAKLRLFIFDIYFRIIITPVYKAVKII